MLDGSDVRWTLVGHDGAITRGRGHSAGLGSDARTSAAGVFVLPPLPPLVVVGPSALVWCVDRGLDPNDLERAWGLEVPVGHRLWIDPRRRYIGVAPELDHVQALLGQLVEKVEGF